MPVQSVGERTVSLLPLVLPERLLIELMSGQSEVLDLTEAAAFLKTSEEDVLRMVQEQGLPGRQFGDGWRFLKAAICMWLSAPRSVPSSQDALLAGAGAFRDDPDLEDIVTEAMRLRGRPVSEGE